MSSFYIKHLTPMFSNEFYAIAFFIFFLVGRVKFILQFLVKVIDVYCGFYFIFTFSFYRMINKFVYISCRAAEVARTFLQ